MNLENDLKRYLDIWRQSAELMQTEPDAHLPSDTLFRLAEPGGITAATAEDLSHLSGCPACIHQWAEWRKALSAVSDMEEEAESQDISFGIRQAAATERPSREPSTLPSSCGRFSLSMFPDIKNPGKGMVVLKVAGQSKTSLEGRSITIRDINGIVLMSGTLRDGELARRYDNISDFDLSAWTIVASE